MLKTILISVAAMAVIPFASAGPAHHIKPAKQQVVIVPAKAVKAAPVIVVRVPVLATVQTKRGYRASTHHATRDAVAYRQANRAAIRQTGLSLRQLDRLEDRIEARNVRVSEHR